MRIKIRITGNEKSRGEKLKTLMEKGATGDDKTPGWQELVVSWLTVSETPQRQEVDN